MTTNAATNPTTSISARTLRRLPAFSMTPHHEAWSCRSRSLTPSWPPTILAVTPETTYESVAGARDLVRTKVDNRKPSTLRLPAPQRSPRGTVPPLPGARYSPQRPAMLRGSRQAEPRASSAGIDAAISTRSRRDLQGSLSRASNGGERPARIRLVWRITVQAVVCRVAQATPRIEVVAVAERTLRDWQREHGVLHRRRDRSEGPRRFREQSRAVFRERSSPTPFRRGDHEDRVPRSAAPDR